MGSFLQNSKTIRLSICLEEELELCFIAELLSLDCFSFIPAFSYFCFRSLITETVKRQPLPLSLYKKMILAKMAYVTKPFLGNSGDPVVRTPVFLSLSSSIPDRGIKIPQTAGWRKKKKKERERDKAIPGSFWGTPNPSAYRLSVKNSQGWGKVTFPPYNWKTYLNTIE